MNNEAKKEAYIIGRATSLKHAMRGVRVFITVTPNFWFHFGTFVVLIFLGFFFNISSIEWMTLILANGLVFGAEAVNSAVEVNMDLMHPDIHPMVRDTKDIAAGAVLIIGVTAWAVDAIIFLPKIIALFS
jgi:diacylglycerol kinase (ATP)